jgi:alpha-methylacyl-CoA racemase
MGPLKGIKVLELGGIGPGPMCAMLLADLGATVLRVDRKEPSGLGVPRPAKFDLLLRNRPSLPLDLKHRPSVELVLMLASRADVLMEGFRPGVAERLGVGPDICLEKNPRLIYGRITGWGQDGPLAQTVGHDINYIALSGALHAFGRAGQPPVPPINLVGDFGGGALYLAMGILAALVERSNSGKGQIVDAAMIDGVASLMTQPFGSLAAGLMNLERGTNVTDSGAPFYDVYECADGKWISLGAVENKFYAAALRVLGLEPLLAHQWDRSHWPSAKQAIAERVKSRTRDEWTRLFDGTESCFAPVLTIEEAPRHPHLRGRGTYIDVDDVVQPAPAPRFSRTVPDVPKPAQAWNADDADPILRPWLADAEVRAARDSGVF